MLRFLVLTIIVCIAAEFGVLPQPCRAEGPVAVTIVLVNDLPRADETADRGGLAKLASIIKLQRSSRKNVIVAHAGNAISPSLLSGNDQGAHMIDLLNRVGVDVMAFGNHEFDFGAAVAAERAREARFPILLANVAGEGGQPIGPVMPTWIHEIDDLRIAFIGLARSDLLEVSRPGSVTVEPALALVERVAPALRENGADLVAVLGALTETEERALVNSGLVDMVLGAAERLHASFDGRTAVAASSRNADHVILLDLRLDSYRVETIGYEDLSDMLESGGPIDAIEPHIEMRFRWSVDFRSLDSLNIVPDNDVVDEIQRHLLNLSRQPESRIGVVDSDLDIRDVVVREGRSPFADAVADAMRSELKADAALLNAGAIRADQIVPAGTPITRRSLVQWLPFNSRILLLRVSGEQIKLALENGVSQFAEHAGRFPIVSGLEASFDPTAPPGSQVSDIMIAGLPLKLDYSYLLAVNDFIAGGGDGYDVLVNAQRVVDLRTSKLLVQHLADYLAQAVAIDTAAASRLRMVSQAPTP
jgi:2',3'-cyclic-nucleotide 2'-phosphodiesterase (5'-nucleotidase family)